MVSDACAAGVPGSSGGLCRKHRTPTQSSGNRSRSAGFASISQGAPNGHSLDAHHKPPPRASSPLGDKVHNSRKYSGCLIAMAIVTAGCGSAKHNNAVPSGSALNAPPSPLPTIPSSSSPTTPSASSSSAPNATSLPITPSGTATTSGQQPAILSTPSSGNSNKAIMQ